MLRSFHIDICSLHHLYAWKVSRFFMYFGVCDTKTSPNDKTQLYSAPHQIDTPFMKFPFLDITHFM